MTLRTRKPTGQPSWPLILLAGVEKSGKSWAAAEATNSELIRDTYWLSAGEDDPDELGRIGRFEIVEHDGSYHAILGAIHAINSLDPGDGKPDLIVLDSMSMIWSMLTDEAQALANRRAAMKAARQNRPAPADDVSISMDLWNRAAKRWRKLMDAIRAHRGPVLLTARLSQVTVIDKKGDPVAGEKDWKIDGHKTLPYDVTMIVQMRSRTERYITGIRSVVWQTDDAALIDFPADLGVADLWARLGIEAAEDRVHRSSDGSASVTAEDQIREDLLRRLQAVTRDWEALERWWDGKHQEPLREATDLHALLELVKMGEAKAEEHRQRISQADTLPTHPDEAPPPPPPAQREAPQERPTSAQDAPAPQERASDRRLAGTSRYARAKAAKESAGSIEDQRHSALASHIAMRLGDLDITARDERLFYTAQLAGLEQLESTKDLDVEQMRDVLEHLDGVTTRDGLEEVLNQIDAEKEQEHGPAGQADGGADAGGDIRGVEAP